jgi:hypothetical protein
MSDHPADRVRDAFLDRLRAETAPVAHEPIARVEVPGMSLLLIEASERYEGCPGCEALRAAAEEFLEAYEDGGMQWITRTQKALEKLLERTNGDT